MMSQILQIEISDQRRLLIHGLGIRNPHEWASHWLDGALASRLSVASNNFHPSGIDTILPGLVNFSDFGEQSLRTYEQILSTWRVAWIAVGSPAVLDMPAVRRLDRTYCLGAITDRASEAALVEALQHASLLASMQ